MKRIAILGCENSHANSFLKYIKEREEFADVEVVGIYSDETAPCEKLQGEYGVRIMERYDEAVGKIDGLIVTARHGDNHYPYAKPYIESGIPMFIDKPITVSEEEAVAFMKELKAAGVKITGGSSLRYDRTVEELKREALEEVDGKTVGGIVRAPIHMHSTYGGFFFYAQLLVEIVGEIFGRYPKSVSTSVVEDRITVLFHYADFDCVGLYLEKNNYYYAARMSEAGCHGAQLGLREDGNDYFYREFAEFYALLNGGEQTCDYGDFIAPVFVMNAITRSLESGQEEAVKEYCV